MDAITIQMLGLLSSKAQGCKDILKPPEPCHVGIHGIALAEYSVEYQCYMVSVIFQDFCIILYWPN